MSVRHLTLIRHAKSSWDDDRLSDFERPLNKRGQRDAPKLAQRLAGELLANGKPRLVSSPALRALTTARIFAEALKIPLRDIDLEPRIYEATPGTLLEIVRDFRDANEHMLMFGHNPGFSYFARLLAECPFLEMPTCAVVTIVLEVPRWGNLNPGDGHVLRFEVPD